MKDEPVNFYDDDMLDRVEAFLAANPPLTNAALRARVAKLEGQLATRADADLVRQLVDAIDGLINMPGDVDTTCNPNKAQQDVLTARLIAWNNAREARSAARAAGYGDQP